ncbi:MAG: hypothetical protein J6S63_09945 [Atopobiaceae bacterium]|nr:hypothetical protein [Atopobiaceae bacterium]
MNEEKKKTRDVESASATTSRDNENSGPFAYVIAGVALGLSLLLSLMVVGCTSFIITGAAQGVGTSTTSAPGVSGPGRDFDFDIDDIDNFDKELEDFLERYTNPTGSYGGSGSGKDDQGTAQSSDDAASVDDVLDFNLAPYEADIESGVSASSYAGVPNEVRDFVRSVVTTDSSNNRQLIIELDNAAKREEAPAEHIAAARQICKDTAAALEALQVPSADVIGGDVAEKLSKALAKAQERWTLLEQEVALLDTTDKVDTKQLWDHDDKVLQATEDAAQQLEEAMSVAAGR